MNVQPIRVGIIGAAPDRGWAAAAHIPALKALPQYALVAVCTRRHESAEATARKFAIPRAFHDARALAEHADIDLVIVTARVPEHRALVQTALDAGKHVFCEWPLALNTQDARAMLQAAQTAGVRHMVGLQGRVHPVLLHAKHMIADGAIGRLLSVSLISSLASWGPRLPPAEEYRTDRANGATGLTIPGGHTLDTLQYCFGHFDQISAVLATQHAECEIIGTNRTVQVTSPDQVIVTASLAGGAVLNAHIKADMATPIGVRLELNGSDGDLLLTSHTLPGQDPVGLQRAELTLHRSRRGTKKYEEILVPIDNSNLRDVPRGAPFYTARLLTSLADAIRNGRAAHPGFADAVTCHELLDTVQRAADTGTTDKDSSMTADLEPRSTTSAVSPDGVRLAIQEWGNPDGHPLLLIHGQAQCHLSFVRQLRSELPREFRVITFDLRGHGASDKPDGAEFYQDSQRWADDLQSVIDALDLHRPVLVGWSMGGRIIRNYLVHHGDRRLGAINFVAARPIEHPSVVGPGSTAAHQPPRSLAGQIRQNVAFLRNCFNEEPDPDDFALAIGFNMMLPQQVRRAIQGWSTSPDASAAALRAITVPTLITHGRLDRLVLPAAAQMTADHVPGSRLSWYDNAGHAPFYEDAPRFNRELAAFAREAMKARQ